MAWEASAILASASAPPSRAASPTQCRRWSSRRPRATVSSAEVTAEIDAVLLVVDHPRDAAGLTFDAFEPVEVALLVADVAVRDLWGVVAMEIPACSVCTPWVYRTVPRYTPPGYFAPGWLLWLGASVSRASPPPAATAAVGRSSGRGAQPAGHAPDVGQPHCGRPPAPRCSLRQC
jgi:hypothetical protein